MDAVTLAKIEAIAAQKADEKVDVALVGYAADIQQIKTNLAAMATSYRLRLDALEAFKASATIELDTLDDLGDEVNDLGSRAGVIEAALASKLEAADLTNLETATTNNKTSVTNLEAETAQLKKGLELLRMALAVRQRGTPASQPAGSRWSGLPAGGSAADPLDVALADAVKAVLTDAGTTTEQKIELMVALASRTR